MYSIQLIVVEILAFTDIDFGWWISRGFSNSSWL